MCPSDRFTNARQSRRQRGFLMPVAIFILIILAGVAITVTRFSAQTGTANTQESISVATFYAAESGGQYALNRLYYSTVAAPTQATVDANCGTINGASLNFTSAGLAGCQTTITCSISSNPPLNTVSVYNLTSRGQCGSGFITADRTIEFSSLLQ